MDRRGRKRSKEKLACEAHVSMSVREAKRGILGHAKQRKYVGVRVGSNALKNIK